MLIRRSLLLLGLAAVGVFTAASASAAAPSLKPGASHGPEFASSPSAPDALVAQDRTASGSGQDGVGGTAQAEVRQGVPAVVRPPKSARESVVVEAQVLEKYRSFRESLTAP